MDKKIIISSLTLILFGVLGGASIKEDGSFESWVWRAIIALVVIFIIIGLYGDSKEKERKAKEEEERERIKKEEEEKEARYGEWEVDYMIKNGVPTKSIAVCPNDEMEVIHVHESKEQIYMKGKIYSFKDILSVSYTDDPMTIKGDTTAITKSDTGSVIGRSIMGGLIGGEAGKIIGGITGEKRTEFCHEDDTIIHDYTVIININSIANPIITFYTGDDWYVTNEIVGLMNAIIARQ